MTKQKVAIPSFKDMKKEGKKIRMVTAYDYHTAALVDQADIEMILVGDSLAMVMLGYDSTVGVTMEDMIHHIKPVVKGAQNTIIIGDMPFGSYNVSCEQAVINATRLMKEGGCDCIKLEGGLAVTDKVEAIVNAGIPVIGHIGLTPQTSSQLGGFKVQGKNIEDAKRIVEEAKALEKAGAFMIVIECVPSAIGKLISESIDIPTIGIGAGPDCDGQVLVTHDMMGMYGKFTPKFVKKYANLSKIIINAFNQYSEEVQSGSFPDEKYSFGMKEEVLKKLY